MRKSLFLALACLLLCGCGSAGWPFATTTPQERPYATVAVFTTAEPASSTAQPPASSAGTATASRGSVPSSPAPAERTPDPASEMLVAGTVTAVLDSASIQVKCDSPGRELVVTTLNRAEYAEGVSKKFDAGNFVRIITSNKLAKTLPERAAAIVVLENKGK